MRTIRRVAAVTAANTVVAALLLAVVEGAMSFIDVVYVASQSRPVTERQHTGYDPLLGWINLPNVSIPDLYGPGRDMFTNSQRLRSKTDFPVEVPPGKIRLVCSGDSFGLGYGVSNDDAWCQQIGRLERRFETVNMGQAGYGVDQMYLWYRRDGPELDHDVHLFAFITDDLFRTQGDRFLGYPKPLLGVEQGRPVVLNEPVPRPSPFATTFNKRLGQLHELSFVRILRKLTGAQPGLAKQIPDTELKPLLSAIFAALARDDQAAVRVLVHLPVLGDYTGSASEEWRAFVAGEARREGLVYIDLIETFRRLPPQEIEDLYIGADDTEYLGYPGHYKERGNRLVAQMLVDRLTRMPEIARLLEQRALEAAAEAVP